MTLLEGLIPKAKETGGFPCPGVAGDIAPMAAIERFLEKFRTAGALPRDHDRHTMKIMVAGSRGSGYPELSQNIAQFNRGQTGPDD
jgi:hypothetical protein